MKAADSRINPETDTNALAVRIHEARLLLKSMIDDGRCDTDVKQFEYLQLWVKYHQELLEKYDGWEI